MILVFYLVFAYFPKQFPQLFYVHWHTVFKILLALAVSIVIFIICSIQYIGVVIQFAISVFWVHLIFEIFSYIASSFDSLKKIVNDTIWIWTIHIVLLIPVWGLHLMSIEMLDLKDSLDLDFHFDFHPFRRKKDNFNINERFEQVQVLFAKYEELYNTAIQEYRQLTDMVSQGLSFQKPAEISMNYVQWLDMYTVVFTIQVALDHHKTFIESLKSPKLGIMEDDARKNVPKLEECISEMREQNQKVKNAIALYQSVKAANEAKANRQKAASGSQQNTGYNSNTSGGQQNSGYNSNASGGQQNSNDGGSSSASAKSSFVEDFFAGCNDKASVKKRYRDLSKIYHPDASNGDVTMSQKLNNAYQEELKKYS